MWAEERNFYHIYPLGLGGAEDKNRFDTVIPPNSERIFLNNQCVSASCT